MLDVITLQDALQLIQKEFAPLDRVERAPLDKARGRVLAEDIAAAEYVPDFDRSTVDGYAVRARDTFGCSDAIPAILNRQAEICMGEGGGFVLQPDCCASIPTGGAVPEGADSVVMLEYTEDYGDGTIGVARPVAPGENLIFRGDDVYPGRIVLRRGTVLEPQDIGSLAAIGRTEIPVLARLRVGIISTGDELIEPEQQPGPGQIRDVNSLLLAAQLTASGAEVIRYGIVPDREELLRKTTEQALAECDAVLLSGGSSVGMKDASCRVIESCGSLLFHGLAIKPGKPTILGRCQNKPVIGLPGHPVAAFFVTELFVRPLTGYLEGRQTQRHTVTARLTENVSANHGRALYCACRLVREENELLAVPIRTKSGLITTLADADGYFCVDRDCEGLMKGTEIRVFCLREC
ncbi:MAG: molybdopterin molybdotransferase MoeA [Mogibacterium sp.]|nr:molybdopterin molybdotransferase MoeA [Mogibacterium sp.]